MFAGESTAMPQSWAILIKAEQTKSMSGLSFSLSVWIFTNGSSTTRLQPVRAIAHRSMPSSAPICRRRPLASSSASLALQICLSRSAVTIRRVMTGRDCQSELRISA